MSKVDLTSIESALKSALQLSPSRDAISSELIIELAERGRNHPEFDALMAQIVISPSAVELYRAARETRPADGLGKLAGTWMEGLHRLPEWFDRMFMSVQGLPAPAYRSASILQELGAALLSPDPANQAIFPGRHKWEAAEGFSTIEVKLDGADYDLEGPLPAGGEISVTLSAETEDWGQANEFKFRFRVLTQEEVVFADWARAVADDAPRAAATVLCSIGLFGEAERIVKRLPPSVDFELVSDAIGLLCDARRVNAAEFYM